MKSYDNFNTGCIEIFRFPGQRGGRPSEVVDLPTAIQIIMMLPGKTAARVRVKASYLLTRFLAGDVTLVEEIYGINEFQAFLKEQEPTNPLCAFRQAVDAGQTDEEKSPPPPGDRKAVDPKQELPEPYLCWTKDMGVERRELRSVKARFQSLLEIEVMGGAIPPKSRIAPWMSRPPLRFADLAQAAVDSVRASMQLKSIPTADDPKRRRLCQKVDDEDEDVLSISEIMRVAGVWKGVWLVYRSDLSNELHMLKCRETCGDFSDRRPQTVRDHIVEVHKYKKSADWPLAWRALESSRHTYEKRIREVLQEAFQVSGHPTETAAAVARALAADLRTSPAA
jgi:hypothetical protein